MKAIWPSLMWAVMLVPPVAVAQSGDASYFCVEEFAGGLKYNATVNNRVGTVFTPDHEFLVSLKSAKPRDAITEAARARAQVREYAITVTQSGSNNAVPCLNLFGQGGDGTVLITVLLAGGQGFCQAEDTDYKFNFAANRFLSVHPFGFVDGKDKPENTPYISGGTCTKVN
jgi:hypothetical protein